MKLFDGWDHVGAKTWVANPARSASTTPGLPGSDHSRGSLSRRPSVSRLNSARQVPSIDDHTRKLKELRLAELTRQLELTELQRNHPHPQPYANVPPPPISRPMTPISKLSAIKADSPLSNPDLVWEEKLREAHELNARIENLRLAGMHPDELPSPVLLPSRPPSRTRTDKPHPNCVPPRDYPIPPLPSFASDAGLRRQPSKKSLSSISSSHHAKSPAPPVFSQPNQNRDRAASASQASQYQALKEAEDVICKLRKSHDELLEKVKDLENQLDFKETENQDLRTRNNRLEIYLADEQKAKEDIQRENERAMNQLRLLSRSQPPQHLPREDPSTRLYTQASEPTQSHHERIPPSQSGAVPPDQNMSKARAELTKREENLRKLYAYKTGSLTPESTRPGSALGQNLPSHPLPPPMSNPSQPHHRHNLYESSQAGGYQFPPTSQPPIPQLYAEEHRQTGLSNDPASMPFHRPLDPAHPETAYPGYLHHQAPPIHPHQFPRPNPHPKLPNPMDERTLGLNGYHTLNHPHPVYNGLY